MSISDAKIQAALTKIGERNKEVFAQNVMKKVSFCDEDNPIAQVKRIMAMEESFILLDEKSENKVKAKELYDVVISSLSTAIKEHTQILIDHAKDSVENL